MNIVVVGAGEVGEYLCNDLSTEGNDITLIETNKNKLEKIIEKIDIMGIVGNGSSYEVLQEADINQADIFIAVTPEDEVNIISCGIAKKLGAKYVIARVRNPQYSDHTKFMAETMEIDMIFNPEKESAKDIVKSLEFPSALDVETFADGRVQIIEIKIREDSYLNGLKLMDFEKENQNKVLICIVKRDDEIFIPNGDFILKKDDEIHVTGKKEELKKFYISVGEYNGKLNSTLVIGGSKIAYYLIEELSELGIKVKLIEKNEKRAYQLSEDFPKVEIVLGDGTEPELLEEERFLNYDSIVLLTGIDEENILISMYAKKMGIKKAITKVNKTSLLKIIDITGLQTIITPKQIVGDSIIKFVRGKMNAQGSKFERLYRLASNRVEAIEFIITEDSNVINISLNDIQLAKDLLIAYLIRDEKIIVPNGETVLKPKDKVIIITTKKLKNLDDILA